MKRTVLRCAWLLLWGASLAVAQTGGDSRERQIDLLLDRSAFTNQIAGAPDIVASVVAAQLQGLEAGVADQLSAAMVKAYSADTMMREIRQVFRELYDERAVLDALAFYATPLARRLGELESRGSGPQAYERAGSYERPQVSDARRKAVGEIFDAAEGLDTLYLTMYSSFEGLMRALNGLLPVEQRMSPAGMDQELDAMKAELRQQMYTETYRETLLAAYVVLYEDATDAELLEYLGFLSSPAGRWMSSTSKAALVKALTQCAQELAKGFLEVLTSSTGE